MKGQTQGVQRTESKIDSVNHGKRVRSIACPSTRGTAYPRRCILPLVRARPNDAHRPPPLTQSLQNPGGRRKKGAHTNAYYNSTRHLAPKDVHCPSPRHDHSKRPKGLGNKGPAKDSPEYSHIPKRCCLVSIVAKHSSAGAALAKKQS